MLILCLVLSTGCNCRDKEQPAPSSPKPPASPGPEKEAPSPASKPAESTETPALLSARMRVFSLSGDPLPGMIPIATLEPNAFDQPIATGTRTNADGMGEIQFPADKKVTLRAWDTDLKFFPNNFLEVLPNTGVVTEVLEVVMVESGTLLATLQFPDGTPVRNENAGLMLFHPVYGPWWPAEADTNEKGNIAFAPVPAGKFVLRLKVASGSGLEIPETYIAPGEPTHLGVLGLK